MSNTRPFKVPESIWTVCEMEAQRLRKETGDDVRWTDVLHAWINRAAKRTKKSIDSKKRKE